jgi:hypothetical protein
MLRAAFDKAWAASGDAGFKRGVAWSRHCRVEVREVFQPRGPLVRRRRLPTPSLEPRGPTDASWCQLVSPT